MVDPKEEFGKLNLEAIKGEVIGLALENHFKFILEKYGPEEVKRLEEGLAKLGYSLKHQEIENFKWYPRKIDEAIYFVLKKMLNWEDEIFRESGKLGAKISYITRVMMRYFVSLERIFQEVGNYWRKYYTVGHLKPVELSLKERYFILELEDFPIVCSEHCRYWEGYFWQITSHVLPKENLKLWETGCPLKGAKVHRFKATW